MIYDPRRRARELRQRILGRMSAEKIEEYARLNPASASQATSTVPVSPPTGSQEESTPAPVGP